MGIGGGNCAAGFRSKRLVVKTRSRGVWMKKGGGDVQRGYCKCEWGDVKKSPVRVRKARPQKKNSQRPREKKGVIGEMEEEGRSDETLHKVGKRIQNRF